MYLTKGFKVHEPKSGEMLKIFRTLEQRLSDFAKANLDSSCGALLCKFYNSGNLDQFLLDISGIKLPELGDWEQWDEENWNLDETSLLGKSEEDQKHLMLLSKERVVASDVDEETRQRLEVDDEMIGMIALLLQRLFREPNSEFYRPDLAVILRNDGHHDIGKQATIFLNPSNQASKFIDMNLWAEREDWG